MDWRATDGERSGKLKGLVDGTVLGGFVAARLPQLVRASLLVYYLPIETC